MHDGATGGWPWAATLAAVLLLSPLGCADGPRGPAPADETPLARIPGRPVDPAQTGTIRGIVRTTARSPEAAVESMAGTATCRALHAEPVPQQALLVEDGLLAGAFVRVTVGLEAWEFEKPTEEAVLDQVGCLFTPRVLGARAGQPVTFLNSDPLLHNVQAAPGLGKRINVALPRPGMRKTVTFDRAEGPIPVRCDVHPWMRAWIFISDHSCFDTTDADGSFEITGVPAGNVTLEAWHETLGRVEAQVDVVAGSDATVELLFPGA